jgi:hypothetical protein
MELADIRKDYRLASLNESEVDSSPFNQFEKWFNEALAAKVLEPNAMTLATINAEHRPSARIVLLKDFDDRAASFFTNYASRNWSGRYDWRALSSGLPPTNQTPITPSAPSAAVSARGRPRKAE